MKRKQEEIEVMEMRTGSIEFCILGITPLILNSMSAKAKHDILLPKGKKNAAQKASTLKHNPYQEFCDAPYVAESPKAKTYLEHLCTSFKAAMRGAAVDIPGTSKAQLGRLLWLPEERVSIYGIPRLFMSVTRNSDINHTPDIRTRVIIPEWACRLKVQFVKPILNAKTISNLLAAAGLTQGVGDWRPEKGSGNYGQFSLTDTRNIQFNKVLKEGGYKAQFNAMQNPVPYDKDTERLLAWFSEETQRRGLEISKAHREVA